MAFCPLNIKAKQKAAKCFGAWIHLSWMSWHPLQPLWPHSSLQCHLSHQVRTFAAAQPRAVVSLG